MQEFKLDGSKIELPHAAESLIIDRRRLRAVLREALAPVLHRVAIMQPQHFHVIAPQSRSLSGCKGLRQRRYIAAGENVLADERARGTGLRHTANAMDEGIAVGRQQLADLAEILVEMADADMLHHADRNNPFKLASELAIVELAKLNKIGNAGGLGMRTRYLDLLRRDVDRGYLRAGL